MEVELKDAVLALHLQNKEKKELAAFVAAERQVSLSQAHRILNKEFPFLKTRTKTITETVKTETVNENYVDETEIVKEGHKLIGMNAINKYAYDPEYVSRGTVKISKDIAKKAELWDDFMKGTIKPLQELMENVKLDFPVRPVYKEFIKKASKKGRKFIATAFDWHVGAVVETMFTVSGKGWNTPEAERLIREYSERIAAHAAADEVGYESCVILFGGDLYHTLNGYTAQGTKLRTDETDTTQFVTIMNLLMNFVQRMHSIFGKVDVFFVRGNHGGIMDIPLGYAIKNAFLTNPNITFEIAAGRRMAIPLGDTMIMLEHGASDEVRNAKIPTAQKGAEGYFNTVFAALDQKQLDGIKNRYLICGDKHHFKHLEFTMGELIQCSALPLACNYAEALNLRSKSRQTCFVLEPVKGITQHIHYTFE